jgi:hypothetical protein
VGITAFVERELKAITLILFAIPLLKAPAVVNHGLGNIVKECLSGIFARPCAPPANLPIDLDTERDDRAIMFMRCAARGIVDICCP